MAVINRNISLLTVLLFFSIAALAQKSIIQSGKSDARLIQSGVHEATNAAGNLTTEYYLVLVWKSRAQPSSFFWWGNSGWWSCSVWKAHTLNNRKKTSAHFPPYSSEAVIMSDIHKGDTLLLKSMAGGKFPIPAEIPALAKNTLFFKTVNSDWLSLPVKKITKLPGNKRND